MTECVMTLITDELRRIRPSFVRSISVERQDPSVLSYDHPCAPLMLPRWKRLRRERLGRAAERRALMRGRRAALSVFNTWARSFWDCPSAREIVRHVTVEPRDAGWELTARMTGRLKCFGVMRGFLRSPEYELKSQRPR